MTDPGCRRQQEIADQRQQLPEKLAIVCAKQSARQPGILFPRKQDIQLSRFPDIPCFYPAFASLLAIWLNNEPVQAIDVIVYGM